MQRLCNVHATTKEHSMHGPCTVPAQWTLYAHSLYGQSMQRLCNVYATSMQRPCTVPAQYPASSHFCNNSSSTSHYQPATNRHLKSGH